MLRFNKNGLLETWFTTCISLVIIIFYGCRRGSEAGRKENDMKNNDSSIIYSFNRELLKKHTKIIELSSGKSALIIVPAWQGRVMTSTAGGKDGYSFGWINHKLIALGRIQEHINAFGGEERFWIGPEGGQFSVFFPAGSEFTYENWQTPPVIDTDPYEIAEQSDRHVLFRKNASLVNYSGFRFDIGIERRVTLLNSGDLPLLLSVQSDNMESVAYRSDNTIINRGSAGWKKETGLLSVWMLSMLNPSPDVTVVIPVREGDEYKLGPVVNDNYFGKISPDRLRATNSHVFFKADGNSRGKIGIPPLRTKGVMGSYDFKNNILTLVFCELPEGETAYVNSSWEIQQSPYSGDAFNSYNDGPLADGTRMGPFYELETSSPAAMLEPGQNLTHSQTIVHITGPRGKMEKLVLKTLGVTPETIEKAFK